MEGGFVAEGMEQTTSGAREQRHVQSLEDEEPREDLEEYRKHLCLEFASISSSDITVALSYLAENGWDMQKALNFYFEMSREENASRMVQPIPAEGAFVRPTDDSKTTSARDTVVERAGVRQHDDSTFSLLTWNIDGLDLENLQERARGVCSYIALYSPDVVFLQEVIPPYLHYLEKRAVSYTIISGNTDNYFTAIMVKKSRVKVLKHEITEFPTTSMMRNLLTIYATISGNDLCLMTSHLESTKDHGKERINQLKMVLAKIAEVPESSTVIFGGDTNLRDKEVAKIGLPNNVLDIWEFLGRPEHCHYTWDTTQNTNLKAPYKCKMRFDRLFFRAATTGGQITPQSLDLIGLEKLDCGRFPSDHWGLLCNFDVVL